jgi:hypothetical protein
MRRYWTRLENKGLFLSLGVVVIVSQLLLWNNPLGSAGSRTGLILNVVVVFGLSWERWRKR